MPTAKAGRRGAEAAFDAGISALPPKASAAVLAGRYDLEFGKSIWELGLLKIQEKVNVQSVAAKFGGSMDSIDERVATRLPNDKFIVQVSDTVLASYTPANRQDVTRWLKETDTSSQERMSPYIQQAFRYATEVGTPVVMAMDLTNSFSPNDVKNALASNISLDTGDADVDQLAKLISGVQGITLGITVKTQAIGAIRIDFSESPKAFANLGKPLLIEVLQNQGAMIDDIRDWTPSINGNTFKLQGNLGPNGARRVMSVLSLPPSLTSAAQSAAESGSEESLMRTATLNYYDSISTMLGDLREKPKKDHVQTFGQAAIWYDKYARKIDNLPVLNVDPELLDYGAWIATSLRQAEATMKGVGMRSSSRTRGNSAGGGYGGYRYAYGTRYGYGYTSAVNSAGASIRAEGRADANIRSQEKTRGAANVQQIWQQIDEESAAIRRTMTQKYQTEF